MVRSRLPAIVLAALSLLVTGKTIEGAVSAPVRVAIEVFGNSLDGSRGPRCAGSQQFAKGGKVDWWIVIGQARPDAAAGWEGAGADIRCGVGVLREGSPDLKGPSGSPYIVANVSTFAWPFAILEIRAFDVEVSLSVRKLTGFGAQGEPRYEQFTEKRKFFFSEGGSAFLPLLLSSEKEQKEFGLHEALMRVEAKPLRDQGASYGTLSITSDVAGAELLLDGGSVGSISAGGTMLNNVLAGDREVRARDSSGREVRKWVRVEKDRHVLVALNFAAGAQSPAPYRLVKLGSNPQGHQEYTRERDGGVVIRIPAGEFLMGNRDTERQPLEHRVELSEYLVDKNEVSWGQYLKFAEATGTPLPPHEPYWGMLKDHPAAFVTWEEATAYCEWAGGRLPTEAEWEKAARGTDDRKYPWGNEEPDPERAVFRRSWGLISTDPVGAHPSGVSPYGLMDAGGNMWEWVSDWYDDKYFEVSPLKNPKGPASGQAHVVRSGSWDSRPAVTSVSCRNWGHKGYREGDFGFRCAMNVPR